MRHLLLRIKVIVSSWRTVPVRPTCLLISIRRILITLWIWSSIRNELEKYREMITELCSGYLFVRWWWFFWWKVIVGEDCVENGRPETLEYLRYTIVYAENERIDFNVWVTRVLFFLCRVRYGAEYIVTLLGNRFVRMLFNDPDIKTTSFYSWTCVS